MNATRPLTQHARVSGANIRRLLEVRQLIKVECLRLLRPIQQRLLEILERARPWQGAPRPVPEMSRGELVRAIRWRVGTIPLAGAIAAAEFVIRHRPKRRPDAIGPSVRAERRRPRHRG